MIILNLLEILRTNSDAEHRLTQQDIIRLLKKNYDMDVDRKTVLRNIDDLIDEGAEISFTEKVRGKGKDKVVVRTDFYYIHTFDESELRLLIDGLLFSKYIPYSQCKNLVKKLETLASDYFKSRVKYVMTLPESMPNNKELFYNISVIDEAISKGLKIKFNYSTFDINKNLVLRTDDKKRVRDYIVTPYQMVATNGRYYLICNFDKYNDITNYRVDRIQNIELLKEKGKTKKEIKGLQNGLDLPKHMMEHIYMVGNESDNVEFKFDKSILNDVVDWFGKEITMKEDKDGYILARTHVILVAMKYWALQYADYVTVLSPKRLVDDIKESLKQAIKNYK